ncbi:tetratricopeptide repeat protein [Actinacidiphila epipremni]|uniref:Tetratricopeptide repeat protein n=1 Tax=Actinacidiphila epipremni TaxID=2053013 RepID=A0ABX0ZRS0_9ACTN|nr:tetratricopeptide repeat protein [Actinacidiphila epipremni]NJP44979.1 tetratricopeptide repeat protein [Actinacidiphila epipremni]
MAERAQSAMRRALETNSQADLDAAVGLLRRLRRATAHTDDGRTSLTLSHFLVRRYELSGRRDDLDEAIDLLETLCARGDLPTALRPMAVDQLGTALMRRHESSGADGDLRGAEAALRQAVSLHLPGDLRTGATDALGVVLRMCFVRWGEADVLEEAVAMGRRAAAPSGGVGSDRFSALNNLAVTLRIRSERFGRLADLDEAVTLGREALAVIAPGHPRLPGLRFNLGQALRLRAARAEPGPQAERDLDAAMELLLSAAAALPPGSPERSRASAGLATAYRERFDHTGDEGDLEAAVRWTRDALARAEGGRADRYAMLSNLGTALGARFRLRGSTQDLQDALEALKAAALALPDDHAAKPLVLAESGILLWELHERTGDPAVLDRSVLVQSRALELMLPQSPEEPGRRSNLGLALRTRGILTGSVDDLDAAVREGEAAADAEPRGSRRRPLVLSVLAGSHWARFEASGERADLDDTVRAAEESLTGRSAADPGRAEALRTLGTALAARAGQAGSEHDRSRDLRQAVAALREAAGTEGTAARLLVDSARRWGEVAAALEDWDDAVEGFRAAVGALPTLAWPGIVRADQERLLAENDSLAQDAAAAALRARAPETALCLLEQGRGVIWSHLLDAEGARAEIGRLRQTREGAELADRLEAIRQEMDTLGPLGLSGTPPGTVSGTMREASP